MKTETDLTSGRLPLQRMFNTVPGRYDLLNRLLTFGIDQRWRRRAAAACLANSPVKIVDLCTGTGDLAILMAAGAGTEARVIGADFAQPMLDVARQKAKAQGMSDRVDFRLADAAELPFADGELDTMGIAFGFRNLTYRNPRSDHYLKEMVRTLRPGGRLVVVETSQPKNRLWRRGFHVYLQAFVAPIGGLISGHRPAYRYLAKSAMNYYGADEVSTMLNRVGFSRVDYEPLLGSIAALHVATR